ncbi:RNA polymerase-associated protein RapA [Alkalisalibacterium limincola]|uniref:RNA polymerase-associated protein RapA n=1 Tax=Alkalisalibacterium limincola TaxID=2699169 RepID=A0A5C8KKN2_9GAMM|nr:RNA polymerase-associated protein RapA [Alkalisalibacterium limincola]TXK60504.1 RNA polymerase-associated protein RapA [Alkalisalibacterium limincola]
MAAQEFRPGQRWFSTAEPELGLATVMRTEGRSVQVVFTACGTVRAYAIQAAPLVRAAFRPGDGIRIDGQELRVDRVEAEDGLLTYHCGEAVHREGELDADQPVSRADSRLLSGRVDRGDQFELRLALLTRQAAARANPGWGVLGARIELIPHQLRVAEVASRRRPPRLLLADEVGLGKTIEACMILAQQLAAGRVQRALVLAPESLVHQWFVELRRRFNLAFAIYDGERCDALEHAAPERNPFEEDQLVIASTDWLAGDEARAGHALGAGWDMLLVDEAHHLAWTPGAGGASPAYALVESLAARVPSLLLLTATPEQLGMAGHFARLRLLDPDRYHDLEAFQAEASRFQELSRTVDALLEGKAPDAAQRETLLAVLGKEAQAQLPAFDALTPEAAQALVDALIDRHGTGRVMLRNRRDAIGGFPARVAHVRTLPADADEVLQRRLAAEFAHDVGCSEDEPEHDYLRDPRLEWLLETLDAIAPAKLLVLCHSRAKVQALEEALRHRSPVQVARFHEDMTLLQRDRNAAWFAAPDGARVLLASEIGAEGRNFQFAQHLLLWDLPLDPDHLEQRIGRLDRIGQPGDVNIHAAALEGSPQHALLRWYAEALGAFSGVVADGRELMHRFGGELSSLALEGPRPEALDDLLQRSRSEHRALAERIAQGRDRLLELASQRGTGGDVLMDALRADDEAAREDDFHLRLLEAFGIHHEDHGQGLWRLDPEYQAIEGFEELKGGPRMACFDRSLALARDDLLYLRADHPMLLSAAELMLSSEAGNAAFLVDELPPRTVFLEAVFVLECIAARAIDASRFLPPQPLRVAVDTRMQPRPEFRPSERALRRAGERGFDLEPQRKILGALVPPMLDACRKQAEQLGAQRAAEASAAAKRQLDAELDRLQALAGVNPAVGPAEIQALAAERDALLDALPRSRVRLDSLRLVAGPDFLSLRR